MSFQVGKRSFNQEALPIDRLEWDIPISRYQEKNYGNNRRNTTVCKLGQRTAYSKMRNSMREVDSYIASYLLFDELDIYSPEVAYFPDEDRLLVEEISSSDHLDEINRTDSIDEEDLWETLAARGLAGITDINQNILAYPKDGNYCFTNIDYERAGHSVEEFLDDSSIALNSILNRLDIEYRRERLEQEIDQIRETVDTSSLRELYQENGLTDREPAEQILENTKVL